MAKFHALEHLRGSKGTLIAFICNHCPYVKTIAGRLVRDAVELQGLGVATIAICANDAMTHPEDSFDKMKDFARQHGFTFPYLHDELKRWPAPMTRSAPQTFSVSTASWSCSIGGGLINRKPCLCQMPGATSSKP